MKLSNKFLALLMAVIVSLTLSVPTFAAPKSGETTETAEATEAAMTEEEAEAAAKTAAEVSEAAEEAETKDRAVDAKISSFNNPNGRILSMSRGGIPRIHPEDSEAGIKQCVEIGVDIGFCSDEGSCQHDSGYYKTFHLVVVFGLFLLSAKISFIDDSAKQIR